MDDVTSALDVLTEKRVRDKINNAFPEATKIIVSQRISSVAGCNQIYLLDKGVIVARGTHDELLKSSQIYKEIYDSQMLKEGRL